MRSDPGRQAPAEVQRAGFGGMTVGAAAKSPGGGGCAGSQVRGRPGTNVPRRRPAAGASSLNSSPGIPAPGQTDPRLVSKKRGVAGSRVAGAAGDSPTGTPAN